MLESSLRNGMRATFLKKSDPANTGKCAFWTRWPFAPCAWKRVYAPRHRGEWLAKIGEPGMRRRVVFGDGHSEAIEPSTIQGYHYIYEGHIKNDPVAEISLIHFTAQDGRRLMESVPQTLSHRRHLRTKNFLSGVFAWAISDGAYHGLNPMAETKVGGHTEKAQEYAYTLEEVADMLDKLDEPARTVCAVAAFTGLSHSELPG